MSPIPLSHQTLAVEWETTTVRQNYTAAASPKAMYDRKNTQFLKRMLSDEIHTSIEHHILAVLAQHGSHNPMDQCADRSPPTRYGRLSSLRRFLMRRWWTMMAYPSFRTVPT